MSPKPYLAIFGCLLILSFVMVFGSCKKEEHGQVKSCPTEEKVLSGYSFIDQNGTATISKFSYDLRGRLVSIINGTNDSLSVDVTYPSEDTMLYRTKSGLITLKRAYNSAGDHIFSVSPAFESNGDTQYVNIFYFNYDSLRQRTSHVQKIIFYRDNRPDGFQPVDTTFYTWKDGLVISATRRDITAHYDYFPGTSSKSPFNVPYGVSVDFNIFSYKHPVMSKWLIKSMDDNTPSSTQYAYTFDDSGLVTAMTLTYGRYSSVFTYSARGKYLFQYACR